MNKYTWSILAAVAAAIIVVGAATLILFSRGLERQRALSHKRMQTVARYCADQIEGAEHGTGDAWLQNISEHTGFERIVVADSFGIVYFSSQSLIERGDDIMPYLVDTAQFKEAARERSSRFTERIRIADTWFKSLYFPAIIDDEDVVVVVEADENYFALARQFRDGTILLACVLCAVLGILTFSVMAISSRARKAQVQAARNRELAFLGQASAELAHELKNPLAIIKSSADVLRKKFDKDKKERAFEFLSDEVMRLSRLVTDILSFSRAKKLLRQPFSPREAIEMIIDSGDSSLNGAHTTCSIEPAVRCIGDRDSFVQIAGNLIRNAAAAGGPEVRVEISAVQRGNQLDIRFCDNGSGIAPELRPRLFDPFVSGSKTGTGLGLAIVRTLCEASGWRIELESSEKGKTCFKISLGENQWQKS
jgi:signal transduction histidine kinase